MKIMITVLLLTVLIGGGALYAVCLPVSRKEQKAEPSKSEKTDGDDFVRKRSASEQINALLEGEDYLAAPVKQRRKMAEELLNGLAAEGLVRNVYYDKENDQYSFLYADGSLGGISFVDFSTKPGKIPMN